jgi:hypothetical protein
MTPKQMYRMMREHGLSIIQDGSQVYVGKIGDRGATIAFGDGIHLRLVHNDPKSGQKSTYIPWGYSAGDTLESAVEDYCNTRNIEWDKE